MTGGGALARGFKGAEKTEGAEPAWPRAVWLAGCAAYLGIVVFAGATFQYNYIDPVVQLPILALIAAFLAQRVARSDRDPAMVSFVMAAFAAKMLGAIVRYMLGYALYNGQVDASDYQSYGARLAPMYRSFHFASNVGGSTGTAFMRKLTAVVYAFGGSSRLGGYLMFSFMAFVGLLLLWRAFCRAVPNGDHRMYGLLVLFLPSFLYWPSAVGKEAWAVFTIGIASYGIARVLTKSIIPGLVLFALGLLGITMLRPHISLTIFCGLLLAAAVAKAKKRNGFAPFLRIIVFGALLLVGLVVVAQTKSFFGVSTLDTETVNSTLEAASGQTSEGGSAFTPIKFSPANPVSWVGATVTVLFRPLPFEAHNPEAFLASSESVFLLYLMWSRRKRLRSIWREMRLHPYVAYSIGVTFTFIFAFSAFSNFGILSRERVQVTPFFMVLLCLPEYHGRRERQAELRAEIEEAAGISEPEAPEGAADNGPYRKSQPPELYPRVHDADSDPYEGFEVTAHETDRSPYDG
ncbi:MAG TPA: hypothetical protein VIC35_07925 [Acidimicrobiia bacterium]